MQYSMSIFIIYFDAIKNHDSVTSALEFVGDFISKGRGTAQANAALQVETHWTDIRARFNILHISPVL